eukprot:6189887-Pleurochrysis_carterae.AAC.4
MSRAALSVTPAARRLWPRDYRLHTSERALLQLIPDAEAATLKRREPGNCKRPIARLDVRIRC